MGSVIAEWYANQHVLVTGATGFMGKILVEKILWSCPKVNTLYILVRPKKGKDPKQRLEDFLASPVSTPRYLFCRPSSTILNFILGVRQNKETTRQHGNLEKTSVRQR